MKKLLLLICVMGSQLLKAQTVGPLIQTQWDQGYPYNILLPTVDGKSCLTSCGTTALAQICYYYRWPERAHGMGYLRTVDGQVIDVVLDNDRFDYDKMLLTYDENSSEEAKQAVAVLMRNLSASGAMLSWEISGSPAVTSMPYFFSYDKGVMHLPCGYFTMEDMKAIIRSELDEKRPVQLAGSNGMIGHAFICDGYNDKGEFHFNYGWGGEDDGWGTLEDCLYPVNMEIDFNIKKDEGGERGFTLSSKKDFKWLGGNQIFGNYRFETYFPEETQLQVALAVENTETHEVQYFCHTDKDMVSIEDMELTWELDADLADGSYVLYPVGCDRLSKSPQWKKAYFRELCQKEILLTVEDGVKTFTNHLNDDVREGVVEVDGLCYELDENMTTASLTYRNDKYASYSGSIVIPETITVEGTTYYVNNIGVEAFRECKLLDEVFVGKNVFYINWGAFDRAAINKVRFAEGSQLFYIYDFAFYNSSIKDIVLPEGLIGIGANAFSNSDIGTITIPSTVEEWGQRCFLTTSLVSMHINCTTPPVFKNPEEFDYFRYNNSDEGDFVSYSKDVAHGITSSVLYVPTGTKEAYAQADIWKDFGFILEPGDDDSFVKDISRGAIEIDDVLYQFNGIKNVARVVELKKDVDDVIINNTIQIGEKTFDVVSIYFDFIMGKHNRVVIPANVETILYHAFNDAEIGSLEFEKGSHLKEIEWEGFYNATFKSPLVLPEGLETLGKMVIKDAADITIPASVTKMDNINVWGNLKHLRVSWPEPLKVEELLLDYGNVKGATLHVPVGTKSLYAKAEGWKTFGKIVEGNDDDTAIQTVTNGDRQADAIYTLDGRRLNVNSVSQLKRGVYIVGGKKVVVR